jgi:rRNA-processing protein CGR1
MNFSASILFHEDKAELTALQRRIQAIKDKRAVKEEKARYEKMAETMHKKRVERLKRREKRNKMLKS